MTAAGFSPIYSGLGPRASVMSPKQEVSPKLTPKERMISLQGELIIVRRIVEGCGGLWLYRFRCLRHDELA